jgi:hypothetical protein
LFFARDRQGEVGQRFKMYEPIEVVSRSETIWV